MPKCHVLVELALRVSDAPVGVAEPNSGSSLQVRNRRKACAQKYSGGIALDLRCFCAVPSGIVGNDGQRWTLELLIVNASRVFSLPRFPL
jgi:hypothetical protein